MGATVPSRFMLVLAVVGLLAAAMPGRATAAPILDQDCCAAPVTAFGPMGSLTRAQTFTVGVTGTLTSVDLLLALDQPAGSIQFDIVPGFTTGTSLAGLGPPLASYTLNWSSAAIASYVNLDFPDISVTTGDYLAIVMRPTVAVGLGSWQGYWSPAPYALGEELSTTILDPTLFTNNILSGVDLGFRTYVDPVPEPATMTLLGSGLGALFARQWRRRRAVRA